LRQFVTGVTPTGIASERWRYVAGFGSPGRRRDAGDVPEGAR
jgi:hypothetical protein